MKFKMYHACINVQNLERSMKFYEDALGLKEVKRIEAPDGSRILSFMGDSDGGCQLELAWFKDRTQAYDLGENKTHFGFSMDDVEGAYRLHSQMGIICEEKPEKRIHFIKDPDGYISELVPADY